MAPQRPRTRGRRQSATPTEQEPPSEPRRAPAPARQPTNPRPLAPVEPRPASRVGRPRKLTEEDKAEIRRRRKEDPDRTHWPDYKLAARFKVARATIQRVFLDKPWPSAAPKMPRRVPLILRNDEGMKDRVIRNSRERDRWATAQRDRGITFAQEQQRGAVTLEAKGTWERHMFDAWHASKDPVANDAKRLWNGLKGFIARRYEGLRATVPRLPLWDEFLDDYKLDKK